MATVTVIIPTYNRSALLMEALLSVDAQTYRDYDVIVVDDGSTDDTRTALKAWKDRIRYLWKPNGGEASARNYGIRHAHTDYVAFLDSDDRWMPEFLATTISYLLAHPEIALLSTACRVLPGDERRPKIREPLLEGNLFSRLFMQNFVTASAVVLRHSCLDEVGLFDESLGQATDYDLWLRISRHHPIAFINQPLCLWRLHAGNISSNEMQHRQRVLDVVTRNFDSTRISCRSYALRQARLLGSLGRAYRRGGNKKLATMDHARALRLTPWRPRAWWDMLMTFASRARPSHSGKRIKNRKGLQWMARQVRHRISPGAHILCYHRVGEVGCDPHGLSISPKRFEQQMEYLSRARRPIPLSKLLDGLGRRAVSGNAVVVTFDDGYASLLDVAYPILKRYEIPVTVFVTSRYLSTNREAWHDELQQILLEPGTLPEHLSLDLEGMSLQWQAGLSIIYTEQDTIRHRHWTLDSPLNPTPRHHLFRLLFSRLLFLPETSRVRIVDELIKWSGHPQRLRPTHRFLFPGELAKLASEKLVEVGAHSESHPILPELSRAQQEQEIVHSRNAIQDVIGKPIGSFAYPYGARSHDTIELLRKHGFNSACITFDDVVFPRTDPFQLPRICVGDISSDALARTLVGRLGARTAPMPVS